MPIKAGAFFMSLIACFCAVFDIPYYAVGKSIDMDRFELVWSDEFDGSALDESKWSGHFVPEGTRQRRGGYWNKKMASVSDGCLTISTEYLAEGLDSGPAGYYSYGMDTRGSFEASSGYFECRCILPKGKDIWAAFWIYCDGVCDVGDAGVNGSELDIFESPYFDRSRENMVSSNIHYDGYGDAHKSMGSKKFLIRGDPYSEFNTFGMEWDEDSYTFYINGRKSFSTDFGGVSKVPEFLILSVETGGDDGIPESDVLAGADKSEFIVDYVRAYRFK
ncbi:MAG: glycoside hydrolase family 16 protein [Clostridia bacterium]|nr:glycoside hydrolase family 16 protein [Clostridia bacterium]